MFTVRTHDTLVVLREGNRCLAWCGHLTATGDYEDTAYDTRYEAMRAFAEKAAGLFADKRGTVTLTQGDVRLTVANGQVPLYSLAIVAMLSD